MREYRFRRSRKAWFRARRPVARLGCVVRRHKHWTRENMLSALTSGRSKRCRWCNRLVLKPQYRDIGTWLNVGATADSSETIPDAFRRRGTR